MKDPLRPNVAKCVKYARECANLNIRLVSGDHEQTALSNALKAGILSKEEVTR